MSSIRIPGEGGSLMMMSSLLTLLHPQASSDRRVPEPSATPVMPSLSLDEPLPQEIRRRVSLLERAPILFALPSVHLRALARRLRVVNHPARSVITSPSEGQRALCLIDKGRCFLLAEDEGRTLLVGVLGPGDIFGEEALLRGRPVSLTVETLDDCTLLVLDPAGVTEVVPAGSRLYEDLASAAEQRVLMREQALSRSVVTARGTCSVTAIYSATGGSGKTTLAVSLAARLGAEHPGQVLLIDLALPCNHAALVSGLVPTGSLAQAAGLGPGIFDETLQAALASHPAGFALLAGALRPEEADLVKPAAVCNALKILEQSFRHIVIDLPVALSDVTLAALDRARKVVLVSTPELTSALDAAATSRALGQLLHMGRDRLLVTVNHRLAKPPINRGCFEQRSGLEVAVEVANDANLPAYWAILGAIPSPDYAGSGFAKDVRRLAAEVAGG